MISAHASRSDGSSPRVRGTRWRRSARRIRSRFIPARAGNAFGPWRRVTSAMAGSSPRVRGTRCRASATRPVHPRACGERVLRFTRSPDDDGSSPRVRGTPVRRVAAADHLPVHPRACGERRSPSGLMAELAYGSSPRVRGTRHAWSDRRSRCRFIPARAGNASGARPPDRGRGRFIPARAGNAATRRGRRSMSGSSPRVQGTQFWSKRTTCR